MLLNSNLNILKRWLLDKKGNVVVETAFIFPILLTMLMGSIDIGMGLLVNKKVISAAHITADLIAREESLNDTELDNYIEAARLAMQPYSLDSFGIDIVGIRFIDEEEEPEVQWRDTVNMAPIDGIEERADGLGKKDDGVVAVTVEYTFTPQFSDIITGAIEMQETAFVKGRITSFVQRE